MWVNDEGGLNTVALPDPTEVMSDEFHRGFAALAESSRAEVEELVVAANEAIFDAAWEMAPDEDAFIGTPPPLEILTGSVATPDDVAAAIARVPERWRLDAILALVDLLDGPADEEESVSLEVLLEATEQRLRLFDGLAEALVDPHALLDIMLGARDAEDARSTLQERFGFDVHQAQMILDHQLLRLTGAGRARMLTEQADLHARAADLKAQIARR
jgi:hypothetical protein